MYKFHFIVSAVIFTFTSSVFANIYFSDSFDDGTINSSYWLSQGTGVTESGGVLNVAQGSQGTNYLATQNTYTGDFAIQFDIQLNALSRFDYFGFSLLDPIYDMSTAPTPQSGISFSIFQEPVFPNLLFETYFASSHIGGVVALDVNTDLQNWRMERSAGLIDFYVDGQHLIQINPLYTNNVPDEVRLYIPGYRDGTDSNSSGFIDNFSIQAVPEPASLLFISIGGLLIHRKL